ncbi:hypothetical protein [Aliivibrio fischeri]|uniref:hypothetical protein n=1 Tax=Aliivibrio fischeri TaxID=668 RepID=UPI001F1C3C62|nr:hypothetical protein [Aliivibrio fischeri]MCE7556866.1 hypothetical protein [Aliivibrio fischeri]MCE7563324.1 hypothetical protein [Aliivibrio fischeri]MCE7570255.1 hypothetical protein [Aliivibrio fischeri]
MKVLTIFIDMIRANRLSTFNSEIKLDTPLDTAFKELGGTVYNNCFTEGPDTPRGMSSYFTGVSSVNNGCNTRLKWPKFFLDNSIDTVFDIFDNKNYKLDLFSSTSERETGLFPFKIDQRNIHNKSNDLREFLDDVKLEDDHFLFISIPDYHWAFDDFGYTKIGEKKSYEVTKNVWDIVFEYFDKDDFDHIFVFSDHGFKFSAERKKQQNKMMLNDDRTNSIMLHREKHVNTLSTNNKLCSLSDLFPTYQDILGLDIDRGISLLSDNEKEYIVIEDHINFAPSLNQNIELWAVVTSKSIYIRDLDEGVLFDRKSRNTQNVIIPEYDDILLKESSFDQYLDEYKKIFLYKKNISSKSKSKYMNGINRKSTSNLFKRARIFIELLNTRLN